MTTSSPPASVFAVCLNLSKAPALDLMGLVLPAERMEVLSPPASARPGAWEVAGAQQGGAGWDLPFSQQ